MQKRFVFTGAFCVLYTALFLNSASAVVKKSPSPDAPAPTKLNKAPLTKLECKRLGGTVDWSTNCKGGSGCFRVDQDGVVRMICITK